MSQAALFDRAPYEVAVAPALPAAEPVSADRRRTMRHAALLAKGGHPISGRRLHPDAAPHDDRAAEGLRCKDCRFRQVMGGHSRGFPKCYWPDPDAPGGPRLSHSAATDCRAWYPACTDFEPRKVT